MWLLITLLMTYSLHEVAEASKQKHLQRMTNDVNLGKNGDCLAQGSNGREYRGSVSVTFSGLNCMYWHDVQGYAYVNEGGRPHNYCRNPDNRKRPWCWVLKLYRRVRKFCAIPKCEATIKKDTEMTCGERIPNPRFKIIGGSKAKIESQPWLASLFNNDKFFCGGTLISPCWVLTAAHCFPETRKAKYSVYLGKDDTNKTNLEKEQKFEIAKIVLHPEFNIDNFDNDIALLQIKNSNGQCAQKTESVRIACLPPKYQMMPYGTSCHIAGYGIEKNADIYRYSHFMKETKVKILSDTTCQREDYYGKRVTETQFCAASPNWNEDACKGDSGGPLLCEANNRMFLFGIISWGEGCATKNKPGVYTKVTNYNTWIANQTGLQAYTAGKMYPQKL